MSDEDLATLAVVNRRVACMARAYSNTYPELAEIDYLMRQVGRLEFGEAMLSETDITARRIRRQYEGHTTSEILVELDRRLAEAHKRANRAEDDASRLRYPDTTGQ